MYEDIKPTLVNTVEKPTAQDDDASDIVSTKLSTFQSAVEKFWLFELFALLISTVGLAAVVITLKMTEGHQVPTWRLSAPNGKTSTLTINSVLSIFSTMVKATVLIPVGAAMGELKWMWFREDHHVLTDVQVFESAARGPLGAAIMLWKFRGKSLACLGAFIIISSLTLDFAFQQLVTYPLRPTSVGNSTIARTNEYAASRPGLLSSRGLPELPMLAALYKGLYSSNTSFTPVPGCSSGNCTWDQPYTSLGLCAKCYSTSDQLIRTCSTFNYTTTDENSQTIVVGEPVPYCNYTMPSGQQIAGWNGTDVAAVPIVVNSLGTAASNNTYFGNGLYAHLTSVSVIRASWEYVYDDQRSDNQTRIYYKLNDANATECGLDFCVLKYQSVEKQAQFTEQIIDTFINTTHYIQDQVSSPPIAISPPSTFVNNSDTDSLYSIDLRTWMALAMNLFQTPISSATIWDGTYVESSSSNTVSATSDLMSQLRYLDDEGLYAMMKSVAAAMTQRMRVAPGDGTNLAGPGSVALGTVFQNIPHVNVRWGWIILPAMVLFLSAIFLISTMLMTKSESMLWKGNGLAHYYHPLTKTNRDKAANATSAKQFEKLAETIKVKCQETEAGGRFVPVSNKQRH